MIFPAAAFCAAMGQAVFRANEAYRHGVTYQQAHAVTLELPTIAAQTMASDVLWYVYVSNKDKRVSSQKLAALIERSCNIRMTHKGHK